MVIKTATKKTKVSLPSKRPGQLIYESAKYAAKAFGVYQDIKQYDPGYYFERYSYKTPKRVTSYIAGKLQKRFRKAKRRYVAKRGQFYKERSRFQCGNYFEQYTGHYC